MDFSLYYTPDYLQELAKKIRMPEAAAQSRLGANVFPGS